MARTVKVMSIHEFKELMSTEKIVIKQSQKGSFYALDEAGLRIASVSEDAISALNEKKSLVVLQLEDFGESWYLITKAADNPDNTIAEL